MLQLFSSEDVDVLSIEVGDIEDSPLLSSPYEELVITYAMSKLNTHWRAKKQEARSIESACPRSKLHKCFPSPKSIPPPRGLPFFPKKFQGHGISHIHPVSSALSIHSKAYTAAGQAMSAHNVHSAGMLRNLPEVKGVGPDAVEYLCQATDLSLSH